MSDYSSALWMPNNNFFPNTGKKSFIVLHGTAGGSSAQGIASYFKSTEGTDHPASTHYIIGQDGTVVQTVLEKDGAYGNGVVTNSNWGGNPNYYTISIEHVKSSTDNSNLLTDAQKQASFKLVKSICERHGIGMHDADDKTGITGHFAIDPVSRARCPGPYPWIELWDYLNGGEELMAQIDLSNPTVASHFTGDASQWKCKATGFTLHGEILTFYKSYGGNALCGLTHLGLPLSGEMNVPNRPGIVYQAFERGVLAFDPDHVLDGPPGSGRVYLMHIDKGLGMDPRIGKLSTQNAALTNQVTTLQGENTSLKKLLDGSNLGQINVLGKQIQDDVALIMKLSQVQ